MHHFHTEIIILKLQYMWISINNFTIPYGQNSFMIIIMKTRFKY